MSGTCRGVKNPGTAACAPKELRWLLGGFKSFWVGVNISEFFVTHPKNTARMIFTKSVAAMKVTRAVANTKF